MNKRIKRKLKRLKLTKDNKSKTISLQKKEKQEEKVNARTSTKNEKLNGNI